MSFASAGAYTAWMLCKLSESDYGGRRQADVSMFLTRHLAAIAALTTCVAAVSVDGQLQSNAPVMTCTNPFSGTTWQIAIDYDRVTVDANPAQISDTEIFWRDAKEGSSYRLDRRSGNLTVTVASSTGGYFLHDRCRLP